MTAIQSNEGLKRTPIYHAFTSAGAKIVPFAGWEMPVQFSSIISEHKAVRSRAGLFDVSHMGEIDFKGPDALENVHRLVSNNCKRLKDGGALYTGMLYPEGTFVDDLLVYRFNAQHFMMVVNAANTDKDFAWIKENIRGNVSVENISDQICQLALQGPQAIAIFKHISEEPAQDLKQFTFLEGMVAGKKAVISRTGYTGEDGLELYLKWDDGLHVWSAIMEAGEDFGLLPAGLGARDTLRLEAGLPLYGNDISDKVTPLEAGLRWTVKFKSGDFIGRDALLAQKRAGLKRSLIGFKVLGKQIPRAHYKLFSKDEQIGEVASGGMAIWLDQRIGTAYVPLQYTAVGTILELEIRNRRIPVEVVAIPFYRREN